MRLQGPAKRLTVFVGESEGFGSSQHVHTTRLLSLSEGLPIVIVMVDDADRIERFALELDELISEGLVVIDDVEVVRYVGRADAGRAGEPT